MENTSTSQVERHGKYDLVEHGLLRNSIFSIVYMHQGFIEVFLFIYMALYMISFGVSLTLIGLTIFIVNLPWIIKPIYGITTDRKGSKKWGRRIPYMLSTSIFSGIMFFFIIPLNPNSDWLFFTVVTTLAYLFSGISDTATDGLVVDSTSPENRGKVQSICWGSKLGGYVIASLLVGFMVELLSWTIYFIFMGIFLLLPIPLFFIAREPVYEIPEKFPWKDLKSVFKKRLIWIILILFILIEFGVYVVLSMMPLFLSIDLNLSLSNVGIVMTAGSLGFFIGCLISGPIFDRLSRRAGVMMTIAFMLVMFFLVSTIINFTMALIFVLIFGLAWGLFQIIQLIVSMDICKKSISATMFSIYMSVYNLGNALGALFGAIFAEAFGFRIAFIIAGFVVLPTLFLALLIKGTQTLFEGEADAVEIK
ncbi:MAG: MFS transporter [Promethearchaeota archaeon]|nr:MAG: MFS transporter [Candidatus Lokiarchaeota archaeon]